MKKILAAFLSLNILTMPAFCSITDDFAQNSLDKELKIKTPEKIEITDDFVEKSLDNNLKIEEKNYIPIIDNFAQNNKNKNPKIVKFEAPEEILPKKGNVTKQVSKKFSLNENLKKVHISIKETLSTKQKIDEGDYIDFITLEDIKINKKIIKKGATVKARIENISKNKIWGVPSDLVIGNFSVNGIPLQGEINKTGANRLLWLRPCSIIMTAFFGTGMFLIPIKGGHARIRPSEKYTLYY